MRVLLSDDRVNIKIYTFTPQICRETRQSGSKYQSVINIYLKRANISFSDQHLSPAGQHLIWGSTFQLGQHFLAQSKHITFKIIKKTICNSVTKVNRRTFRDIALIGINYEF